MQAVWVAVSAAFSFYISSAVACYSALGDAVPGEVLQGFEQAPDWWVPAPVAVPKRPQACQSGVRRWG